MTANYMTAVLVLLIFSHLTLIGHAQGPNWSIYSSTADQFTVSVPPGVRMSKTADSKSETTVTSEQTDSWASDVSIYEAAAASDQESKFRILVVNATAKVFDSISRHDLLTYLSVMIIGDDDDPSPTSQKVIRVNGLTGKEYVWAKKVNVFEYGSTNEIFKRGRIFDQGDKIYVIVFIGEHAAELKSPTTERFFNSFRLNKAKTTR